MKYSIFLFAIIFLCNYSIAQDGPPNYFYKGPLEYKVRFDHSRCYTKYKSPAKFEMQTNQYVIYTGDELSENIETMVQTIQTSAPKIVWEKRIVKDPYTNKDKLLACGVEIPAQTEDLTILIDTTQSKDFVIMDIDEEVIIEDVGDEEMVEVICGNFKTKEFIEILQNALGQEGYYSGQITKIIDAETLQALRDYQTDNDLRIGLLDLETARALGVIF